jgi:hypothetical protein
MAKDLPTLMLRILSPQRLPFRHPGKLNKMNSLSSTQRSVKSSLCPLLPNFLGCLCEVLVRSSIVALKDRVSQMSGDTPCNDSSTDHSTNRAAAKIVEQKLRQLRCFACCVPGRSEVPNVFPPLIDSGPGEDVIVRPLTLAASLISSRDAEFSTTLRGCEFFAVP